MKNGESIMWKYSEPVVSHLNKYNIPILVIAGPSGVGKTFLADYLAQKYTECTIIKNYTTRGKRPTDNILHFEYVSSTQFSILQDKNFFFLSRSNEHPCYGYSVDDLQKTINENRIPIFMFRHSGTKTISKLINNCYIIIIESDVNMLILKSQDVEKRASIESSIKSYDMINQCAKSLQFDHVLRLKNNYKESFLNYPAIDGFIQKVINDRLRTCI